MCIFRVQLIPLFFSGADSVLFGVNCVLLLCVFQVTVAMNTHLAKRISHINDLEQKVNDTQAVIIGKPAMVNFLTDRLAKAFVDPWMTRAHLNVFREDLRAVQQELSVCTTRAASLIEEYSFEYCIYQPECSS